MGGVFTMLNYNGVTSSSKHYQIKPIEGDFIHTIDKINKYLTNQYPDYKNITIYFVDGEIRAKVNTYSGEYIKLKQLKGN